MDRNRRLDSESETIVHILHAEGTATDLIDAIHERKKAMLDGFEASATIDLRGMMKKYLEDN